MKVETEYARYWIENEVLHFIYNEETVLTISLAKKIISDLMAFQEGRKYPIFCDINGIVKADKIARDYIADETPKLFSKVSLLSSSILSTIIGNFFIHISKPVVPVKMFRDKNKALEYAQAR